MAPPSASSDWTRDILNRTKTRIDHDSGSALPVSWTAEGSLTVVDGADADWRHAFYASTVQSLYDSDAPSRMLGFLEAAALGLPCVDPALILLHTGRSGSTLLTRALESVYQIRIMREPDPLHDALIAGALGPRNHRPGDLFLRARIAAGLLGSNAHAAGLAFGLKLPALSLLALTETAAAFPTSPMVCLLRDPIESARSMARQPPDWIGNPELESVLGADLLSLLSDRGEAGRSIDIARRYVEVWCLLVDEILAFGRRDRILILWYEDLLRALPTSVGSALKHAGLMIEIDEKRTLSLDGVLSRESKGLGDSPFVRSSTDSALVAIEAELRTRVESRMRMLRQPSCYLRL